MKRYLTKSFNPFNLSLPVSSLTKTIIMACVVLISCSRANNIEEAILNDKNSYYYIDFSSYPSASSTMSVGIFDSGTGGLAVLNDIVTFSAVNDTSISPNITGGSSTGLRNESFIYLGDLANMPYGSYSIENNTGLLIEHIMKDVQFILDKKYYQSGVSPEYKTDKSPVKAIIIACNTATAYGLDTIRNFLKKAGLELEVIGVIDAGAGGALANFSPDEHGSIAILATDATVRSEAYVKTINSIAEKRGQTGDLQIFQQAGIGIAEAVDESIDFIDRSALSPRPGYKGPSETGEGEMKINLSLWNRYNFDMEQGAMLYEGEKDNPRNLQINSVENYISFHLVSLMEKIKESDITQPLNSVILACTHYPFYEESFRKTFSRLRDLKENGEYVYRPLIAGDLTIINPSTIVAGQLYQFLSEKNLLNKTASANSEFYISVPNLLNKSVELRNDGSFTYEYKYRRRAGQIQEYVKYVPFSNSSIPKDILNRLSLQIPEVYEMMIRFNNENPKTEYLREEERIAKPEK